MRHDPDALKPLLDYASPAQRRTIEAVLKAGSVRAGAKLAGVNVRNVSAQIAATRKKAAMAGWAPEHDIPRYIPQNNQAVGNSETQGGADRLPVDMADELRFRLKKLEADLVQARKDQLTAGMVRREILGLRKDAADVRPPQWVLTPRKTKGALLAPVSMWSDWHWGEVVSKEQVNGVNEYDLGIARERAANLVARTADLCTNHAMHGEYPGFVLLLGGDMVSGTIHEELTESNDAPIMPAVVDVFGALKQGIQALKDRFGRVYLPCVAGNHGRTTHKPRFKNSAYSNFDWLIYSLLDKHFEDDPDVVFQIPEGADARFDVFNHRFLLTHGDKLGTAGGDGMIGILGPVLRGRFKTSNSLAAIGMDFDTLVLGHYHQYTPLPRVIINGSLKGYDEYAKDRLRAVPERAQQALCFVHPQNGIVMQMAVYADAAPAAVDDGKGWVSWRAR